MNNTLKLSKIFKPKTKKELKHNIKKFYNTYPDLLNFDKKVLIYLFEKNFSFVGKTENNKYYKFEKNEKNTDNFSSTFIFLSGDIILKRIKEIL